MSSIFPDFENAKIQWAAHHFNMTDSKIQQKPQISQENLIKSWV
jgi:hypothetical protein